VLRRQSLQPKLGLLVNQVFFFGLPERRRDFRLTRAIVGVKQKNLARGRSLSRAWRRDGKREFISHCAIYHDLHSCADCLYYRIAVLTGEWWDVMRILGLYSAYVLVLGAIAGSGASAGCDAVFKSFLTSMATLHKMPPASSGGSTRVHVATAPILTRQVDPRPHVAVYAMVQPMIHPAVLAAALDHAEMADRPAPAVPSASRCSLGSNGVRNTESRPRLRHTAHKHRRQQHIARHTAKTKKHVAHARHHSSPRAAPANFTMQPVRHRHAMTNFLVHSSWRGVRPPVLRISSNRKRI